MKKQNKHKKICPKCQEKMIERNEKGRIVYICEHCGFKK